MSAPSLPTPAATGSTTDAEELRAADTRHHRAVLQELIDMGTDIARTVHKQALAAAAASDPKPTPELSAAFDRIARCVRRTVLLAGRIAEPPKPAPAAGSAAGPAAGVNRTAARTRILREVEDTIDRHAFGTRPGSTPGDAIDTDVLHAELHERLDSPDLDDDIRTRPIPDIIADIVRDLGIGWTPRGVCPSRRRTPRDLAALHARAAAPIGAAPSPPRAYPAPPRRPILKVGRISEAPSATAPAPAPTLVPIPEDPPPDLAAMLALCATLAPDG